MRKKKIFALLFVTLLAFAFVNEEYRVVPNNSFQVGEKYIYKVKYGFLTIGEANIDLHKQIFLINNRPCYRVNVLGKTAGITSIFRVRNTYRSYIDTSAFVPQKFIYSAREGNYKRDQTFRFDHSKNVVQRLEKNKKEEFNIPKYVQDVISSYYFLRILDFDGLISGDTLDMPLFFDDEIYDMKLRYDGYEKVKTKFGKIDALRLIPILPYNDLFKGKEAIRIYVSNDENRVPLRLEIDFSFGTIKMEMVDYLNVKNPFIWK